MAVEVKSFPGVAGPLPALEIRVRNAGIGWTWQRRLTWGETILAFLFVECAVWAARLSVRSRWAAAAGALVILLALVDRPSLQRLGLGLPSLTGAGVILATGLGTGTLMVLLVKSSGGEVPANPTFPNLHMAWQYVIWALAQEFILQSFFYTRLEELFGSSRAVWITATLFAMVHLPNAILTTFTLVSGLFFCEMFRRYRSIYPLAIAHAVLGLSLSLVLPDSLLMHMRVGIGYLR